VAVKNLTKWTPPSGSGYVNQQAQFNIATNLGSLITDNLGNFLVTNTSVVIPKSISKWTLTPKGKTSWGAPSGTGYFKTGTATAITDQLASNITDQTGASITDNGLSYSNKYLTTWTASGA